MKQNKIFAIIAALCVLSLTLTACHNKKKIAESVQKEQSAGQRGNMAQDGSIAQREQPSQAQTTSSVGQEQTPSPSTDPANQTQTPTPVEESSQAIVELVEEALEKQADQAAQQQTGDWTPQYQTAYGKGLVVIHYMQRQLVSPVVVTYIADSIIVASVQPIMGIEMYRLEAHPDKARLFEKLNRRYVEMTYEEISAQTRRNITFPLLERMVEEVGLTYPIGQDTTVRYSGIEATLTLQYRTINERVSAFPLSLNGYNRTTIKALLNK